MDMKVNSKTITQQRKFRSWSQQQLADVSALSLRTIQRIENTGNASYESLKAIAASFDLDAKELIENNKPSLSEKFTPKLSLLALLLAVISSFLYTGLASANPIMLDVSVSSEQGQLANVLLLNELGKESEVRIENQFKVIFESELTEEKQIRIKLKAYAFSNDQHYNLIGSPTIVTNNREAAGFKFKTDDGKFFELEVTPDFTK